MKADAFLEKVHGQYTRILERKITLGLLSKSPSHAMAKRAYGGLVYLPLIACSSVLFSVVRPIEMVASAAIHLVGAAFAQDRKAELLQARRIILVRFPLSLIEAALRMISLPLDLLATGFKIIKAPVAFEEKIRRMNHYDDLIDKLNETMKDAQNETTKAQIQKYIDRLKKNIPVSIFELLSVMMIAKKEYRKAHPEAKKAEKPKVDQAQPKKPAEQILALAKKYGIEVSRKTKSQATGIFAQSEAKKEALKWVIKRLQFTLHPDKTIQLPEAERLKRAEDMKVLNQANASL